MRKGTGLEICSCFILVFFVAFIPVNALREQEYAYEPSQKYKEGKYILERQLLVDVQ